MLHVIEQRRHMDLIKGELNVELIKQRNEIKDYKIENHEILLQTQ